MGHAVYPSYACYSDPWRPYSPFLFDEIQSGSCASPDLHCILASSTRPPAHHQYGPPLHRPHPHGASAAALFSPPKLTCAAAVHRYHVPLYFQPMSTFQMGIGSGVGVGVPPENHPSSWFAAVVGRKRWLLHPDSEPEPREMMARRTRDPRLQCKPSGKTTSTLDCIQNAGEVMWVPNYWWHETCGLDEFSAGIGGITYKGCCEDIKSSVPPDVKCKRYDEGGYGIRDIPHCKEHECGTL